MNLIPRKISVKISKWINSKQLIALLGSRQVGKTSILYLLIEELKKRSVDPGNIFYFDLENFDNLELLNSGPDNLSKYVKARGKTGKKFVFIDEVQYLDNPSNLLKQLVDHYSDEIKLFATGSSALTIQKKFRDSLVGRKITFEVYPLSFEEYLTFKKESELVKILEEHRNFNTKPVLSIFHKKLLAHYFEYIRYGGYPAVALLDNPQMKIELLQDIYVSYIRKDVQSLFSLENISAFNKLVKLLALQTGNLINIQEISKSLGIARPTVEKYMTVLQDTYICQFITPFFSNKKKEIVKMAKVYFYDTGLRNRIINDFKDFEERLDKGGLLENSVFLNLLYYVENKETIKFWRTKHGSEVDFVIDSDTLTAIEVKANDVDRVPLNLKSYMHDYQTKKAVVLNNQITLRKEGVSFTPYYCVC